MRTAFFRVTDNGLLLAPGSPPDFFERFKISENVRGDIYSLKRRSLTFHRRFFAMLNYAYPFIDSKMPIESFYRWIALKVGFFDVASDGTLIPRSISFANMEQQDFEDLYNRTAQYLLDHVVNANLTPAQLRRVVDDMIRF